MEKSQRKSGKSGIAQCSQTIAKGDGWPTEAWDKAHVAILAAIILAIGTYLISTTVLIAQDGTLYIERAKRVAADPVETVRDSHQSPGYPFLVYLVHKVAGFFHDEGSIQGWIISAQVVSLVSKVIASVALYLVGSFFVGSRLSFWGVLILSILPDSAEYGSDALSDWPYLMFLATGFLLLLSGVRFRKCWMFGLAGIVTGLGFLVRNECCQLIIYGGAWLLLNLISPRDRMSRARAAGAVVWLLGGFAVIAVPYMWFTGYVIPEQRIWSLPKLLSMSNCGVCFPSTSGMCPAALSMGRIIGDETLITNICETLMYYFTPYLLVGCYYYFRKQSKTLEQTFFAAVFVFVNVSVFLWHSSVRGFLSRRHTLALVAFTVFYIPVGLRIIACWLSERLSKNNVIAQKERQRWFLILLIIGVVICLPKLLRPMRIDKQGYKDTAEWLSENTAREDIIAVPDNRIAFYAERKWVEYWNDDVPAHAKYVVRIVKNEDEKPEFGRSVQEKYSVWVDRREKKRKIVTYEMF